MPSGTEPLPERWFCAWHDLRLVEILEAFERGERPRISRTSAVKLLDLWWGDAGEAR